MDRIARTLTTAVAVVALSVLAVPGAAKAKTTSQPAAFTASPASSAAIADRAWTVAQRYWGQTPCSGQVALRTTRHPAGGVDAGADAWVTFTTATGDNDLTAPAATYHRCVIDLGATRWPTASSMRQDWDVLCLTVIHEAGHLLGHPHDDTPDSVMAPVFTSPASVPAICRTSRPSALTDAR